MEGNGIHQLKDSPRKFFDLSAQSLVNGVQAGLTSSGGTTDITTSPQNLILQNLSTQSTDIYPKIRVWRDIH